MCHSCPLRPSSFYSNFALQFLVFLTRMEEKDLAEVNLSDNDERTKRLIADLLPHVRELLAQVY